MNAFDVAGCRRQFPALKRTIADQPVAYLDGPAGSQVPQRVADAVADYLLHHNANCHGKFATSEATDALLSQARRAVADFIGAADAESIVFGPNMTSLTFALSRAMSQRWMPGDEVIVTRCDHDANVTPWVLAARDSGAKVHHVEIRRSDCTLQLGHLQQLLSHRTRLVAVGCASNAVGTVHPVKQIVEMAHGVGAEVFLDAVHFAPHRLIDVQDWGCDYLVCSAYKFFGPHAGILWGRRQRLSELPAYKVRPAPGSVPERWMTGTQSHEAIVGVMAAIDYLADIGWSLEPQQTDRRDSLEAAFRAISQYEQGLMRHLIGGLLEIPQVKVLGIGDLDREDERVPTVAFTHAQLKPAQIARGLGSRGIFVWDGNFYALSLSQALGLEPEGMVRVGLLHYNTRLEVDRLIAELRRMSKAA